MLKKLKGLVVEEKGQALTEYGLIIGLIAVICIGALTAIGAALSNGTATTAGTGILDKIKAALE